MTIDVFMKRFDLHHRNTVIDWINKDWIPGTTSDEEGVYSIPEEALPPYTRARAKRGNSVYISMLKGVCSRKHILPALYKMSENEFQRYTNVLADAGLIMIDEVNGIRYYRPSLEASDYLSNNTTMKMLLKQLQPLTEGVVAGSTKALLDYNEFH